MQWMEIFLFGISLWGGILKNPLMILPGHGEGVIFDIAFSPNGALFASASADGTIVLWDANTFQIITVISDFDDFGGQANDLEFSPDGSTL